MQVKINIINVKNIAKISGCCVKLIGLIERTFQREGFLTLHVMTEMHFLPWKKLNNIMHGHVKMNVMR